MDINSLIGIKVTHKKFGNGVIIGVSDDKFADIDFNGQVKKFKIETLEAFVSFEDGLDKVLVNNVSQEVKTKIEKEKADLEAKRIKMADGVNVVDSERNVSVRLNACSQIRFNRIDDVEKPFIKSIFNECDKQTMQLYEEFSPKMQYPKMTSSAKSRYCVGFLCNYLNTFVLRVFSRNDAYKKRVRTGVTVLKSDTTEIARILYIDNNAYCFLKNFSFSRGNVNNSLSENYWHNTYFTIDSEFILNEVVRKCDCNYLNDFTNQENVSLIQYSNLLFSAIRSPKAEIVLKNKLFLSAYRIKNLNEYLSDFTSKQIDFASKNDLLNTLPIIKNFGLYEIETLKRLEEIMKTRGWRGSVYENIKNTIERLNLVAPDLDQRLIRFVKNKDDLDVAVYADYVSELGKRNNITVADFFNKNYVELHNEMMIENRIGYSAQASREYEKIAKELSWIDRFDSGYYVVVPKTIEDFRQEGGAQHNCVFTMQYYLDVINNQSVIVFLRKQIDQSFVTIEYDAETFEVLQARGKFNKVLDSDLDQYVVELGKQLYHEKYSSK